jgi:hypothetical protein
MAKTETLPPFIFLGIVGNVVKIHDLMRRSVIEVHFRRIGVSCPTCDTDHCSHINYAFTVPEVKKEVWKRINDSWNLPNPDTYFLVN